MGTDIMQESGPTQPLIESNIRRCAMFNVQMPLAFKDNHEMNSYVPHPSTSPFPLAQYQRCHNRVGMDASQAYHRIWYFAKFYAHAGWLWLRLSGQIYLEIKYFEWIGQIARGLCERVASGEWMTKSRIWMFVYRHFRRVSRRRQLTISVSKPGYRGRPRRRQRMHEWVRNFETKSLWVFIEN